MKKKKTQTSELNEDKKLALHYMETLTDVARESFLILDSELRVISANPIFYHTFKVSQKMTENIILYELGNGQWKIPPLKSLLEKILPEKKNVRNFEVKHTFPAIGEKTMLLNAGQIDSVQLIILAIEDISERKKLEEKLAGYTKGLEVNVNKKTVELQDRVRELELLNKTMVGRELKMVELKKEIENLKKRAQNDNGNNGNKKKNKGNHEKDGQK